jgi:hypothetical protein
LQRLFHSDLPVLHKHTGTTIIITGITIIIVTTRITGTTTIIITATGIIIIGDTGNEWQADALSGKDLKQFAEEKAVVCCGPGLPGSGSQHAAWSDHSP